MFWPAMLCFAVTVVGICVLAYSAARQTREAIYWCSAAEYWRQRHQEVLAWAGNEWLGFWCDQHGIPNRAVSIDERGKIRMRIGGEGRMVDVDMQLFNCDVQAALEKARSEYERAGD